MEIVDATFQGGKACFVIPEGGSAGDVDPGLLGWFVDQDGKWTVALVIHGELVFVSGFPQKTAEALKG